MASLAHPPLRNAQINRIGLMSMGYCPVGGNLITSFCSNLVVLEPITEVLLRLVIWGLPITPITPRGCQ